MEKLYQSKNLIFYSADDKTELNLPFVGNVRAGFPSPADDFTDERIDLNKILIKHPLSTFYAKVKGNSMEPDFSDGDLLIIDRSLEWSENRIALCYIDNEFTVKRIRYKDNKCYLIPANKEYPKIEVGEFDNSMIWGVINYSIKKH